MKKSEALNKTVCLQYCSYYKPGKNEALACGGYETLARLADQGKVVEAAPSGPACDARTQDSILIKVCGVCGFREDGCDFIVDRISTPCGGFLLISRLIADGKLRLEEI